MKVFCDLHPESPVEYFCGSHNKLMCHECTFELHSDHIDLCQRVLKRQFDSYVDIITERLEGEKQRIAELSARFQRFRLKDGDYETAEGFMSIVNDAQRTLA